MSFALRTRRTLHLPITLGVVMMVLNVTLMICCIVLFSQYTWWTALIVGTVVFAVILVGLSFYTFLLIKEVRLNQRQANFVDSVTHELKSPIASLKLYLETLTLRQLTDEQRHKFYGTMDSELERLDHLITQLLEVGRLDAIGQHSEPHDIPIESLLRQCAQSVCAHHKIDEADTFTFDLQPGVVHARGLVLETIFRNLLDNAIKYGGEPPRVTVTCRLTDRGKTVHTRIVDNGEGVPVEQRKQIFRMFYRAGDELHRRQKGTGLGLFIVQTLVKQLRGRIMVLGQPDSGGIFDVELPAASIKRPVAVPDKVPATPQPAGSNA